MIRSPLNVALVRAEQDVEKVRQLCSRLAQGLDVRHRVRLAPSLAAASLVGLFEHPAN